MQHRHGDLLELSQENTLFELHELLPQLHACTETADRALLADPGEVTYCGLRMLMRFV